MSDYTNSITWHEISSSIGDRLLPDADAEIIIYDEELDDVFLGHLDAIGDDLFWVDNSTAGQLPAPAYWAEKPFPAGV